MERNYDEVIADMLIQLEGIEHNLLRLNERIDRADKLNRYFLEYIDKNRLK